MSAMTNWRDMVARAQANGATGSNPTGNTIADQLYQISNNPALMVAYSQSQPGFLQKAGITPYTQDQIDNYHSSKQAPTDYLGMMGQRTVSPVAATQSPAQFANNTGLINTASSVPYGQPSGTSWSVTPDQLVQNRVHGLLDSNNPLMQQAKTQGLIAAQERGLLNTSMGAEAGQKALYDYAVPIATVDAQTLASASKVNADNAVQLEAARLNATTSAANSALSAQTQKDIAAAQMNFNSLQNVSEGVRYGWGTLQSGINQVLSSNMTPAAKDAAVRDMTSQYLAYANTVGSIYQVDLGPLLSQWTAA